MFTREKIQGYLGGVRHRLTLKGHGEFLIRRGAMILDFLLKQGADLPHLCKLGDCARCKAVLLRGQVKLASHQPHALKPAEKERGVILTCRATPLSDATIALTRDTNPDERKAATGEIVE